MASAIKNLSKISRALFKLLRRICGISRLVSQLDFRLLDLLGPVRVLLLQANIFSPGLPIVLVSFFTCVTTIKIFFTVIGNCHLFVMDCITNRNYGKYRAADQCEDDSNRPYVFRFDQGKPSFYIYTPLYFYHNCYFQKFICIRFHVF